MSDLVAILTGDAFKAGREWDESKVERYPKGDPRGGQFAPKDGVDDGGEEWEGRQAAIDALIDVRDNYPHRFLDPRATHSDILEFAGLESITPEQFVDAVQAAGLESDIFGSFVTAYQYQALFDDPDLTIMQEWMKLDDGSDIGWNMLMANTPIEKLSELGHLGKVMAAKPAMVFSTYGLDVFDYMSADEVANALNDKTGGDLLKLAELKTFILDNVRERGQWDDMTADARDALYLDGVELSALIEDVALGERYSLTYLLKFASLPDKNYVANTFDAASGYVDDRDWKTVMETLLANRQFVLAEMWGDDLLQKIDLVDVYNSVDPNLRVEWVNSLQNVVSEQDTPIFDDLLRVMSDQFGQYIAGNEQNGTVDFERWVGSGDFVPEFIDTDRLPGSVRVDILKSMYDVENDAFTLSHRGADRSLPMGEIYDVANKFDRLLRENDAYIDSVNILADEFTGVMVAMDIVGDGDGGYAYITFGPDGVVELDEMILPVKDADIGHRIFMEAIRVGIENGFDRFTILADLTIGKYAWAKAGMRFKNPDPNVAFKIYRWLKGFSQRDENVREYLDANYPSENDFVNDFGGGLADAPDIANFDLGGIRIPGHLINNKDVPADMEMHIGKAFMLDIAGYGSWYGVLTSEDAWRLMENARGTKSFKAGREWDESKVERYPKGDPRGGQFAPKDGAESSPGESDENSSQGRGGDGDNEEIADLVAALAGADGGDAPEFDWFDEEYQDGRFAALVEEINSTDWGHEGVTGDLADAFVLNWSEAMSSPEEFESIPFDDLVKAANQVDYTAWSGYDDELAELLALDGWNEVGASEFPDYASNLAAAAFNFYSDPSVDAGLKAMTNAKWRAHFLGNVDLNEYLISSIGSDMAEWFDDDLVNIVANDWGELDLLHELNNQLDGFGYDVIDLSSVAAEAAPVDFESLNLRYDASDGIEHLWDPSREGYTVRYYEQTTTIDPETIETLVEKIDAELVNETVGSVSIYDSSKGKGVSFTIDFKIVPTREGDDYGKVAITVFPGNQANIDYIQLNDQGRGHGLAIANAMAEFALDNGLEELTLVADITIGKYAWAKMGFQYGDDTSWRPGHFWNWIKKRAADNPKIAEYMNSYVDEEDDTGGWNFETRNDFFSPRDFAEFDIPGVTIKGADILNDDVPADMDLPIGKAYMLDEDGHGDWNGYIDPLDLVRNFKNLERLRSGGKSVSMKAGNGRKIAFIMPGPDEAQGYSDLPYWDDLLVNDWTIQPVEDPLVQELVGAPVKGGPGSGYHKPHRGREGERGGSAPRNLVGGYDEIPQPGPEDKFIYHGDGVKGKNGSKLVAYQHVRQPAEKWSAYEGGLVSTYASDFERAEKCNICGRKLVHVYWVEDHRDGKIRPYGREHLHDALGYQRKVGKARADRMVDKLAVEQNKLLERQKELVERAAPSPEEANIRFWRAGWAGAVKPEDTTRLVNPQGLYVRVYDENDARLLIDAGFVPETGRLVDKFADIVPQTKEDWDAFFAQATPMPAVENIDLSSSGPKPQNNRRLQWARELIERFGGSSARETNNRFRQAGMYQHHHPTDTTLMVNDDGVYVRVVTRDEVDALTEAGFWPEAGKYAKDWNPDRHPRWPAGDPRGGQFRPVDAVDAGVSGDGESEENSSQSEQSEEWEGRQAAIDALIDTRDNYPHRFLYPRSIYSDILESAGLESITSEQFVDVVQAAGLEDDIFGSYVTAYRYQMLFDDSDLTLMQEWMKLDDGNDIGWQILMRNIPLEKLSELGHLDKVMRTMPAHVFSTYGSDVFDYMSADDVAKALSDNAGGKILDLAKLKTFILDDMRKRGRWDDMSAEAREALYVDDVELSALIEDVALDDSYSQPYLIAFAGLPDKDYVASTFDAAGEYVGDHEWKVAMESLLANRRFVLAEMWGDNLFYQIDLVDVYNSIDPDSRTEWVSAFQEAIGERDTPIFDGELAAMFGQSIAERERREVASREWWLGDDGGIPGFIDADRLPGSVNVDISRTMYDVENDAFDLSSHGMERVLPIDEIYNVTNEFDRLLREDDAYISRVNINAGEYLGVEIMMDIVGESADGYASITFGPDGEVSLDELVLPVKDAGIGHQIFMEAIRVGIENGFDRFTTHADLTIGKYAWARAGMRFKTPDPDVASKMYAWLREIAVYDESVREYLNTYYPDVDYFVGDFESELSDAPEVASFDLDGLSIPGDLINNNDVPGSMMMHVGKAFMLDDAGYGDWYGVLTSEDVWDLMENIQGAKSFKAGREWDESKVKRYPKGDPRGGRFAPKNEGGEAGVSGSDDGESEENSPQLDGIATTAMLDMLDRVDAAETDGRGRLKDKQFANEMLDVFEAELDGLGDNRMDQATFERMLGAMEKAPNSIWFRHADLLQKLVERSEWDGGDYLTKRPQLQFITKSILQRMMYYKEDMSGISSDVAAFYISNSPDAPTAEFLEAVVDDELIKLVDEKYGGIARLLSYEDRDGADWGVADYLDHIGRSVSYFSLDDLGLGYKSDVTLFNIWDVETAEFSFTDPYSGKKMTVPGDDVKDLIGGIGETLSQFSVTGVEVKEVNKELAVKFLMSKGNSVSFVIQPSGNDGLRTYIGLITLPETGSGIGKDVLRRIAEFAEKNKFDSITLTADITIGAYAWAKMGFSYEDESNIIQVADDLWQWMQDKAEDNEALRRYVDSFKMEGDDDDVDAFIRFHDDAYLFDPYDFATFNPSDDIVLYGDDISNSDVPADMELSVGKAFMLDDNGHGQWYAVASPEDVLFAIGRVGDSRRSGKAAGGKRPAFLMPDSIAAQGYSDLQYWVDVLHDVGDDNIRAYKAADREYNRWPEGDPEGRGGQFAPKSAGGSPSGDGKNDEEGAGKEEAQPTADLVDMLQSLSDESRKQLFTHPLDFRNVIMDANGGSMPSPDEFIASLEDAGMSDEFFNSYFNVSAMDGYFNNSGKLTVEWMKRADPPLDGWKYAITVQPIERIVEAGRLSDVIAQMPYAAANGLGPNIFEHMTPAEVYDVLDAGTNINKTIAVQKLRFFEGLKDGDMERFRNSLAGRGEYKPIDKGVLDELFITGDEMLAEFERSMSGYLPDYTSMDDLAQLSDSTYIEEVDGIMSYIRESVGDDRFGEFLSGSLADGYFYAPAFMGGDLLDMVDLEAIYNDVAGMGDVDMEEWFDNFQEALDYVDTNADLSDLQDVVDELRYQYEDGGDGDTPYWPFDPDLMPAAQVESYIFPSMFNPGAGTIDLIPQAGQDQYSVRIDDVYEMLNGMDDLLQNDGVLMERISVDGGRSGLGVSVKLDGGVDGEGIASVVFEPSGRVYLSELVLPVKNAGIGHQIFTQILALGVKNGFRRFVVNADITIGKYAWAKVGLDFAMPKTENAELVYNWLQDVGENNDDVRRYVEENYSGKDDFIARHQDELAHAPSLARFDLGSIRLSGAEVKNDDVPADMDLHIGKAFMLDESGLGSWVGTITAEEILKMFGS